MIVKVQRPLAAAVGGWSGGDITVYGQDHLHQVQMHGRALPPWLLEALQTAPKMFAHADWIEAEGRWAIGDPAEWQPW